MPFRCITGWIAGISVNLINETTAAAIALGVRFIPGEERNILVYDMGAGTFDVSLLSLEDGIFEVKATAGDTHLGGVEFDRCIVDHCAKDFASKNPELDLSQKYIYKTRAPQNETHP